MIRLFIFIIISSVNLNLVSQNQSFYIVNLAIENTSILNQSNNKNVKELLFKKLSNYSNQIEGLIIDTSSNYLLVSDVYFNQSTTFNSGFLPIGKYNVVLKLKLIYKSSGISFKELNYSKDYIVNTESEALKLLINDFTFSEVELSNFLNSGYKRLSNYYSENCNLVIETSKKYQNIGELEKALIICLSVPENTPCYLKILDMITNLNSSLSYNLDYQIFIESQELVSKGDYEGAFTKLSNISINSKFYEQAQKLTTEINDFKFKQIELSKRKEILDSKIQLKEQELELQQKKNELQQSINQTNIEIANKKNETNLKIASKELENQKQLKEIEMSSQEKKEMIKTAGNLLSSYLNRPQPTKNNNFYIIK